MRPTPPSVPVASVFTAPTPYPPFATTQVPISINRNLLLPLKLPSPIYARLHSMKLIEMAESFSMTHEIPIVKLNAVKYLNQSLEFDVVAMQTSSVDQWLAMDTILNGKSFAESVPLARELSFPRFWQSQEMEGIIQYAYEHREEQVLYLAGFQSDLGRGNGFDNHFVIPMLAKALRNYGLKASLEEAKTKLQPLLGLRNCVQNGFPHENTLEEAQTRASIKLMSQWTAELEPAINRRFPTSPHGSMLLLLPTSLEHNLQLCLAAQADAKAKSSAAVTQKSGEQEAEMIFQILKTVSREEHVMSWTHARLTKHRELLRKRLPGDFYSIGIFTLNGEAILSEPKPRTFAYPAQKSLFQLTFKEPVRTASFLELQNTLLFQSETPVWIEGALTQVTLGREFEGIMLLPKMSKPLWFFNHLIKK